MEPPAMSETTEVDVVTRRRMFLLTCYWFYRRSLKDVKNRWRDLFGRSSIPTDKAIMDVVNKFNAYGTVCNVNKGRSGPHVSARAPEEVDRVEEFFSENPSVSTRRASQELGISRTSLQRILKHDVKLYPYKIQMFQLLTSHHIEKRLAFGRRMLRWLERGKLDPSKIWFSDEAHFWLTGHVNKQNHRFWAKENPHIFQTTVMKPERLTVWCAVSSEGIIGPIVMDGNVTGERYKAMLLDKFLPAAHGLGKVDQWWYMQDGALPHRTNDVFEVLDEHFHGRVIGLDYESRYGCGIEWPACSPDLNPCDFFLWGYLKDRVYQSRPRSLQALESAIISETRAISAEMLGNVIGGFKKRLEELVDSNGAHFEQYLQQSCATNNLNKIVILFISGLICLIIVCNRLNSVLKLDSSIHAEINCINPIDRPGSMGFAC
jgi:hypothetical protein